LAENNRVLLIETQKSQNQSGKANQGYWGISFLEPYHKTKDENIGWISTSSTTYQIHLKFPSQEEAQIYIKDNKLFLVQIIHAPPIKKTMQAYADRFK
jgi:hypothetical protein